MQGTSGLWIVFLCSGLKPDLNAAVRPAFQSNLTIASNQSDKLGDELDEAPLPFAMLHGQTCRSFFGLAPPIADAASASVKVARSLLKMHAQSVFSFCPLRPRSVLQPSPLPIACLFG